jgi:hypothetical protein
MTEKEAIMTLPQVGHPLHTVYAIFETLGALDDYRAFSYLVRIEETLPESINVQARILGRYRGPHLSRQIVKAERKRSSGKAPHYRGIGRIRRHVLSRFKFSPSYHWFSNIDSNLYSSLRWMMAWNKPNSRAVIFAHSLDRGLKLVELIFLFANEVPAGIVLVLLDSSDWDPLKLATLRHWGVTVLLDGSEAVPSQPDTPFPLQALEFDSLVEKPLLAKKCASADWADLLKNSQLTTRNPEKVLFFRPDWMKCGSATTFAKLSKLFQARGSILIDVALQPYAVFCGRADIAEKIAEVEETLSPAFHINLRRAFLPVSLLVMIFFTIIRRPKTVAGYMPIFYQQCVVPRGLKRLISSARIDYLYVNHYFTLPLAKGLKPNVPVFLDTHDIQSLNYVSHDYHQNARMRAAPFTECLKEDLAIVDVADRVTMVSREEIELVKKYRPSGDFFYYIPVPDSVPKPVSNAPCRSPVLQALIVASRNPANERSLAWFLKRVWPKIKSLPYQLTIIGNINRSFEDYSHPNVKFAGLVDDLQAEYQRANLILLPITNGGGIAIKSLEAIQTELPIVCTPHAMRGLPLMVQQALPGSLTDIDMVNDLTELACNPSALAARRDRVIEAHCVLTSMNFDVQMNQELDLMCSRARSQNRSPIKP